MKRMLRVIYNRDAKEAPMKIYEIRCRSDCYSDFKPIDFTGVEITSYDEMLDRIKKNDIKWKAKKGRIGDLHKFGFYHNGYSKRFIELLKENGITNFNCYELIVSEPKDLQKYYYIEIQCKPIKVIKEEKKGLMKLIQYYFDLNDWGGEDLFQLENYNCHMCTEKIKRIAEENKLTNFKFEEFTRVGDPEKQENEYPLILSKENLEGIDENDLPGFLSWYVYCAINSEWNREYEIVMELPLPLRVNYVTYALAAEVNNGGYHQYFWNMSGVFAFDAVEYLKLINANNIADATQKALDIVTGGSLSKEEFINQYKNRVLWQVEIDKHKTILDICDEQFYNDDENLWWLRIEYLNKHLQELFIS